MPMAQRSREYSPNAESLALLSYIRWNGCKGNNKNANNQMEVAEIVR